MIGLAMGLPPKQLGMGQHIISTKPLLEKASVHA